MFGDLYSMEADNDEIDVCMKSQVNNETAVTEAGTDTEATDVSNISEKTEAHNELASTGGVATGSDIADMEMDPVAATESYCFKRFSMSAEDIAAEVEENIKAAKEIPDANTEEDNTDPELEAVGMNNAGISTEDPADIIPDETPADTAGMTPDADESKDDGEDDADDHRCPSNDRSYTQQLHAQEFEPAAVEYPFHGRDAGGEEAGQDGAQRAAYPMHRNRADGVVDLDHLIEEFH